MAEVFHLKYRETIDSAALWQGYHTKSIEILRAINQKRFDLKVTFIVDDRIGKGQKIRGEFLTRQNHRNYFDIESNFIPFISADDAKFLYLEGRIKKFLLFMPEDFEIKDLFQKVQPHKDDVIIITIKRNSN